MNTLKKSTIILIFLIGTLSFSKKDNEVYNFGLNLKDINVEKILLDSQSECRPSSQLTFYVETKLEKKFRGYNTIDASIFILDKTSGKFNLLANESIIVPFHKDTFLDYDLKINKNGSKELNNGDRLIGSNSLTPFSFNELIKYDVVYSSYLRSTNKLLNNNRTL